MVELHIHEFLRTNIIGQSKNLTLFTLVIESLPPFEWCSNMLRKILKTLLALLVILCLSGYSALWVYVSNYHKNAIKESINSIVHLPFVKSFNYEKLTISGFPFCNKITIEKPRIIIDVQYVQLQRNLHPDKHLLEIYPDESFVVITNPLVSSYTLKPKGDLHLVNYFKDTDKHFVVEHDSKLQLHASKSIKEASSTIFTKLSLKYFLPHVNDPLTFSLWGFNEFSFIAGNTKILEQSQKSSSEKNKRTFLYENASAKLNFAFNRIGDNANPTINYTYHNISMTENFGPAMNELYRLMGSMNRISNNQHYYGKINGEGKISLANMNLDTLKEPLIFKITGSEQSDISKSTSDLSVTAFFKNKQFDSAHIDYHTSMKDEPKSFDMLLDFYLDMLRMAKMLLTNLDSPDPVKINAICSLLEEKMIYLVPKIHELGQIDINLHTILNSNDQGLHINITKFDFLSDLYNIHLKGNLNYANRFAEGAMNINVTSYQNLVERWYKTYALLSEPNSIPISKTYAFLNYISTEKNDPNNISFTLKLNSNFPFVKEINGQEIKSLLALREQAP